MARNLENLYIPSNRSTNDAFRKGYERIKWERDIKYPEEHREDMIERVVKLNIPKGALGHWH